MEKQSAGGLPSILLVADPGIKRGVAGLVAGRLVESYRRPAVVMAVEDGVVVASGRSTPEFNMIDSFIARQDMFIRFGGHSQAAGFTLDRAKLPILESGLRDDAEKAIRGPDPGPTVEIDAQLNIAELNDELMA